MPNHYFQFKQFAIRQDRSAMKVGTDGVLLGAWTEATGAKRILDIGTGTGLVAIMLAQRSGALIDAIEPDEGSAEQAMENAGRCPWKDRIRIYSVTLEDFLSRDMYRKISGPGYDLIVSNPPYFMGSLKNPDTRKSMSRHAGNLDSGELLRAADHLLGENGRLSLILPLPEGDRFISRATTHGWHLTKKMNVKPLPHKEVKRILMTFERQEKAMEEKTIVIESGDRHAYSREYIELTREYYLHF